MVSVLAGFRSTHLGSYQLSAISFQLENKAQGKILRGFLFPSTFRLEPYTLHLAPLFLPGTRPPGTRNLILFTLYPEPYTLYLLFFYLAPGTLSFFISRLPPFYTNFIFLIAYAVIFSNSQPCLHRSMLVDPYLRSA